MVWMKCMWMYFKAPFPWILITFGVTACAVNKHTFWHCTYCHSDRWYPLTGSSRGKYFYSCPRLCSCTQYEHSPINKANSCHRLQPTNLSLNCQIYFIEIKIDILLLLDFRVLLQQRYFFRYSEKNSKQ